MTTENIDKEVVEAPSDKKPKLTLIVILAVLTGVLFMFAIGGVIYHVQSRKALEADLANTKDELSRKTQLLSDSQEQVVGLSRQMHALREFSVAKANAVAAAVANEPSAPAPASTPPAPVEPEKIKSKPVAAPAAKKSRMTGQDCQLVGKSQEEQAATLKRCMQTLDGGR